MISIQGTFVFFAQFGIPFLIICSSYVMISFKINSGILAKRASTEMARFNDMATCGNGSGCGTTARVGKLSGSGVVEEGAFLLNNHNSAGRQSCSAGSSLGGGGANEAMKLALEQRKSVLNRRLRTNKMLIGKLEFLNYFLFLLCSNGCGVLLLLGTLCALQLSARLSMAAQLGNGTGIPVWHNNPLHFNEVRFTHSNASFSSSKQFNHLESCAVRLTQRAIPICLFGAIQTVATLFGSQRDALAHNAGEQQRSDHNYTQAKLGQANVQPNNGVYTGTARSGCVQEWAFEQWSFGWQN